MSSVPATLTECIAVGGESGGGSDGMGVGEMVLAMSPSGHSAGRSLYIRHSSSLHDV